MTKRRRPRRLMAIETLLATVAIFMIVGSASPGNVVLADPPEPYISGYFDQASENTFYVELGEGPLEGHFALVVPGTGVFWSSSPLTITEELDGSYTLEFDGEGFLDSEATIDTSGLPRYATTDDAETVEFELSGTLTDDLATLELDFEYDSQVFEVDSAPAPETADGVVDDTIDAFENGNWTDLRTLFVDALTDEVDATEFASQIASILAPFGDLDSVDTVDSVVYQLNPSPGFQLATVTLEFTFLIGMTPHAHETKVTYLFRESSWQLLEIESFEDARSLEFLTYPGTSILDESFVTQPSISVLGSTGTLDEDDDSTEVALAIGDGPGGAALTCAGGLTATAVDGVAKFEDCVLDKPGEYTLIATATDMIEIETPAFRVVQLQGEVIADGDPLTLTTLSRGASAWFEFEATDDEHFGLLLESDNVDFANLYVRRQDSANPIASGSLEDGQAFLELRNPGSLEDAEYFLVVRGLDGDVGDFTATLVTFEDVSDEIEVDGEQHPLVTTRAGSNARFDFNLGPDTSLVALVTMSAAGTSGAVTVFNDQDEPVYWTWMEDSAATVYSNPLPSGDYYLIVDPTGATFGTITVTPTAVEDEIIVSTLETPEFVEIEVAGQNARIRFTGTASTLVAIDFEASDFAYMAIYLIDPTGSALTWNYFDSATGHLDAFELPSNGIYEVWIVPGSGEMGELTVTTVDETP